MSQTAGRTLDLFQAVVGNDRPRGLMELADETGIDKSTAARLLGLLVDRGLICRSEQSRRYEVGPEFVAMLTTFTARLDVRRVAAPHLTELRQLTGETVSLHLRIGQSRVCVDGLESEHPVRRVAPLGESMPLYQGPSGKVILAHLDAAESDPVLAAAQMHGVDIQALREQLDQIRAVGFALTDGDRTPGVRAESACILGPQGPVGSITIAGPSARWSQSEAESVAGRLANAAHAISSFMGGITE
jgi:DNA-binding IclR family transcriptional regulator